MRRLLRASLLVAVVCLAMPALGHHAEAQRFSRELDGWAVASFTLTDQHGQALTEQRLRGNWTFMLFGDTTGCAQRCDAALSALAGLSKRIERADVMQTTQVVFISLDPQRDTPARLRDYLASFDPRFVGGTGAPSMLHRLADELSVKATPTSAGVRRAAGRSRLAAAGRSRRDNPRRVPAAVRCRAADGRLSAGTARPLLSRQ